MRKEAVRSKKLQRLMKILWRRELLMQVSVGSHLESVLNELVIILSVHQNK